MNAAETAATTAIPRAARSCSARLWSSSILFRRLGLGATRLHRGRRADRAVGARPLQRARAATSVTEIGIALAVHRRARASAEPIMAAAQGHLRPRAAPGDVLRTGDCGYSISAAASRRKRRWRSACRSECHRLPRRADVRAENELNTPQGERALSILLFQDRRCS